LFAVCVLSKGKKETKQHARQPFLLLGGENAFFATLRRRGHNAIFSISFCEIILILILIIIIIFGRRRRRRKELLVVVQRKEGAAT